MQIYSQIPVGFQNYNSYRGSVMPQGPGCYCSGPSYSPAGYDAMFNPMGQMGMPFGSPMMFMMNQMMQMMQMMMGGQQQQMPPFQQCQQQLPNPGEFWGTNNGNGYQDNYAQGTDSQIWGGRNSTNQQVNTGRHALQNIDSRFGSTNLQTQNWGSGNQAITTGGQSYNQQFTEWNGKQRVSSGNYSQNYQLTSGNSSQAVLTGNQSITQQVTGNAGPDSVQALRSGNGASNTQVGAADQFTRTGNYSDTVQVDGKKQEVKAGTNANVSQVSAYSNNADQKATVGAGSNVYQAGGLDQTANLKGPNSTVDQVGTGGTISTVNVDESKGTKMSYQTNGSKGNTWQINYGDESQSRSTNITADMKGNTTVRNLGGGDDRQYVKFADPKNTGNLTVNMDAGNDGVVFQNMPADPNAKYVINGGEGENFLQMPGRNFTLMNPDGSVLRQFGNGGPAITVSNVQTLKMPGFRGGQQTISLVPSK